MTRHVTKAVLLSMFESSNIGRRCAQAPGLDARREGPRAAGSLDPELT